MCLKKHVATNLMASSSRTLFVLRTNLQSAPRSLVGAILLQYRQCQMWLSSDTLAASDSCGRLWYSHSRWLFSLNPRRHEESWAAYRRYAEDAAGHILPPQNASSPKIECMGEIMHSMTQWLICSDWYFHWLWSICPSLLGICTNLVSPRLEAGTQPTMTERNEKEEV